MRLSCGSRKLRDRGEPSLQDNEQRDTCDERENDYEKRGDAELRVGALHIHWCVWPNVQIEATRFSAVASDAELEATILRRQ